MQSVLAQAITFTAREINLQHSEQELEIITLCLLGEGKCHETAIYDLASISDT